MVTLQAFIAQRARGNVAEAARLLDVPYPELLRWSNKKVKPSRAYAQILRLRGIRVA